MRWQILCDFDGTISQDDVVCSLLDQFAISDWNPIANELVAGAIGTRECMARLTELLRGDELQINTHLDQVKLDPGFKTFVEETNKIGLPLTIVSDGYDYAIKRIFANHGIENLEIIANRFSFCPDNTVGLEFPYMNQDCAVEAGNCKCSAMGRLRNRRTVMIGDGISDYCAAEAADFVFAKGSLIQHCRTNNIRHRSFTDFTEITPLLGLISGQGDELLALADREAA